MGEISQAKTKRKEIDVTKNDFITTVGDGLCEVCGTRYAIGEAEERGLTSKDSHMVGRMHEAYTKVRSKAAELRKRVTLESKDLTRSVARDRSKSCKKAAVGHGRDSDKGRNRGKSRERSREKSRDRDRKHDRKHRQKRSRSRSKRRTSSSSSSSSTSSRGRRRRR